MFKKLKCKIKFKLYMLRCKRFIRRQERLQRKCERCSDTMRAFCLGLPDFCKGPYDW